MTTPQTAEPPPPEPSGVLPDLEKYLEVSQARFRTCIDETVHPVSLDAQRVSVHLQYVKFDRNTGEPKFDVLATTLAKHVVRFSLSAGTRDHVRKAIDVDEDEGDLFMIARDYFRKMEHAGEVGELLLFFLLEAAFKAPQVVCKMELKTNPRDEVKGTDGIHIKWDEADDHLDVFLGESKLHKSITNALDSLFKSITDFYDRDRLDEELHLVTAHFKQLDDGLKNAVTKLIDRETAERDCHIIHACLVGWDWEKYKLLLTDEREQFIKEFEEYYKKYAPTIEELLNKHFLGWKYKQFTFKFLFLPFRDVGEFRRAFYRTLLGVGIGQAND